MLQEAITLQTLLPTIWAFAVPKMAMTRLPELVRTLKKSFSCGAKLNLNELYMQNMRFGASFAHKIAYSVVMSLI